MVIYKDIRDFVNTKVKETTEEINLLSEHDKNYLSNLQFLGGKMLAYSEIGQFIEQKK